MSSRCVQVTSLRRVTSEGALTNRSSDPLPGTFIRSFVLLRVLSSENETDATVEDKQSRRKYVFLFLYFFNI